ncbi:MAG: amidohydrolase family protein [Gammaproteobacteria bacterium]|nr:amidohydrolase family protein [Gammaproteobacteria bacterium]
MHDLVIKNATIIDGLGNPSRHGQLAVKDGRIADIGDDVGAGQERVDAQGLALSPGIIDLHTHYDAHLTWDPWATPSVGLGVSTVVIGNCGFTIAPCRAADRDRTLRNLTHVEGMSLDALRQGVDWSFESYPEYLDLLASKGSVPNVASFVGHSSVRTYVLGDEASDRAATPDEVARMKQIVKEALAAGAVGFATSTLEQHNGEAGIPMPSRLADEHEMRELTGALGEAGRGVFMLTKGMTTTIPWLEDIAAANGRPVMIAAMFIDPNDPERVFREIAEISNARGRGHELWAQVGCFPLGMEFTLRHPYPLEAFLAWRPAILAEGSNAFIKVLSDPEFRAAIKAEAATATVPNRFSYHTFETLTIVAVAQDRHRDLAGKRIADLAREASKDPFDWLLDFGIDGELDALLDCKLFNTDEDRVKDLLRHPNATVALSDAGAHLSFLCDAGFGLHMFGHWSRERADIALEQAVASVTSRAADVYRIKDRGRLVPGAHADLLLFDPDTVGRGPKRHVNDLPGGGTRVDTPAIGVHGVWVNGTRVVDTSGITGEHKAGQLLRQFDS